MQEDIAYARNSTYSHYSKMKNSLFGIWTKFLVMVRFCIDGEVQNNAVGSLTVI